MIFEGNRYVVTRGTIGFCQSRRASSRYFDIEAETRVRVPNQTYRVTLGFTGHDEQDRDEPQLRSAALRSGHRPAALRPDHRHRRGAATLNPRPPRRTEEDLLKAATARLLTGSISAPVSRAVEQALGVDLQITPSIGVGHDPLTPPARLILGKRISNRAYVTFARPLGSSTREQIIVLEYDQNDRIGWVLDAERRDARSRSTSASSSAGDDEAMPAVRIARRPRCLCLWPLGRRRTDARRPSVPVAGYIGKPIVEVRLVSEGRPTDDPASLALVETRVGQPLSMPAVRESITHLFGLGRFQDVRVEATRRARRRVAALRPRAAAQRAARGLPRRGRAVRGSPARRR